MLSRDELTSRKVGTLAQTGQKNYDGGSMAFRIVSTPGWPVLRLDVAGEALLAGLALGRPLLFGSIGMRPW
jgi:hypothetical protein